MAKILLGQDNWPFLATQETFQVKNNKTTISRSLLGWALHGLVNNKNMQLQQTFSVHNSEISKIGRVQTIQASTNFELESIRVGISRKKGLFLIVRQKFCRKRKFNGEEWEIGLLWNKKPTPKIKSYPTALKRLFIGKTNG